MALLPVPTSGYWSNRSDIDVVQYIHECPRSDAVCRGGLDSANDTTLSGRDEVVIRASECWAVANLTSPQCVGHDMLCEQGSFGPLCGAVEPGEYTWSDYSSQLEECAKDASEKTSGVVTFVGIMSGGGLALGVYR